MQNNNLPEKRGASLKRPKQDAEDDANRELSERLRREFQEGFTEAQVGTYTFTHCTFRTRYDPMRSFFDSPEELRRVARQHHQGVSGQPDQYDGYVYDTSGKRIGVHDPADVVRHTSPKPSGKTTVTYMKAEPLALPQYSESTLRQQIMEAQLDQEARGRE